MRTCSINGCDRKHVARGFCRPHWKRWRQTGDAGTAEVRRHETGRTCEVVGCDRAHSGRGLCNGHLQRALATGSPGASALDGHWTGDDASYVAVHIRLRKVRGHAREHTCQCGQPAAEWAYDHAAGDERRDERGRPYSTNLAHYAPLCVSCHRTLDNAHSALSAVRTTAQIG